MDLDGYALVVGGGSGIGKACAEAFATYGATGVVIADIDTTAAKDVTLRCKTMARTSGFQSKSMHIDVTQEDSVQLVVNDMKNLFGRIDYCVICAGIGAENGAEISETSLSEFQRFLDINVLGSFIVTRAVCAAMRLQDPKPAAVASPERGTTRGAIVHMGSLASILPSPGIVPYTTSKHAVLGLSRNSALDNIRHQIRVNCVCPSWVDTPMVQRATKHIPGLDAMINRHAPMGRVARPSEIADAVIFLCSPRSSYTTGCALVIDGGIRIGSKL
ncbi:NAD(P)-binding protein [Daldinia sp. FL1419]|nr:NAD(P)-binding protein [Daldinia sp. FL1419]